MRVGATVKVAPTRFFQINGTQKAHPDEGVRFKFMELQQRLQAQDGVVALGQPVQQLLGVGGDGLIGDHVGEVLDAVQLLGGFVQLE